MYFAPGKFTRAIDFLLFYVKQIITINQICVGQIVASNMIVEMTANVW